MPSRLRGTDGFTLLEVLIAFTVLATLLAVMDRSVVTVRAGAYAFDERTQAAVVARSVLAEVLADRAGAGGTRHGSRDGLRYTVTTRFVDLSESLPPPPPPEAPSVLGAPVAKNPAAKDPEPGEQAAKWVPQRVIVDVETGGSPVETEVVRLVKPAAE